MTDRRDPQQRASSDAAKYRVKAKELGEQLARKVPVIEDLRKDAVAFRVLGRLRHVDDFYRFIGLAKVLTEDGGIDGRKFEVALSDLLIRRPELAAPHAKSPPG